MKAKDFKSVKDARKAAVKQLEFYNRMMATKNEAEEIVNDPPIQELLDNFNLGYKMSETGSKKKLFVVDTISTFRHRYIIEAECLEHAYDEVTMINSAAEEDRFEEFSQLWLGETIVDGREIKMKHFNKMLEEDKECCAWMGEDLIRKINYGR